MIPSIHRACRWTFLNHYCVAWAEAKYKEQRVGTRWNAKKKLGCWTPATDDLVETELKLGGRWPWIHVLCDRARNAEFGVLAGA